MDEPQKNPHGIGRWCAWAVVALLVYVLSIGPVVAVIEWRAQHYGPDESWNAAYWFVYMPVLAIEAHGPALIANPIGDYIQWW